MNKDDLKIIDTSEETEAVATVEEEEEELEDAYEESEYVDELEERITKEELSKLTEEFNKINIQGTNENIVQSIASILSLPDDSFRVLAPGVMQSVKQTLNNPNNMLNLAQSLNATGTKAEDFLAMFSELNEQIDNDLKGFPKEKREFLKELIGSVYNAVSETEGIAKRILVTPIELCAEGAIIPQYQHLDDAGADVYAIEDITIAPGEQVAIPTGLKIAVPNGYALLVHPRSGLSAKSKLRICNSIGLIDAGYRDEIKILVENIDPPIKDIAYDFDENGRPVISSILHGSSITITKGQRLAQLRLVEVPRMNFVRFEEVTGIGENRGGGLGSTGA